MGDFIKIYSYLDVLLLAEVFNNFKDLCMKHYVLNLEHFITLPSWAYNSCLLQLMQEKLDELFYNKEFKQSKKLLAALRDKKNYINHHTHLDFALSMGLKI